MDRLTNINQQSVDTFRSGCQTDYPNSSEPLPGSRLKVDDHIMWLQMFPMVTIWGSDNDAWLSAYCPDYFGEMVILVEGQYINDRAPADPQDLPAMPIYGQTQFQRQQEMPQKGKHSISDEQRALQALLAQVEPKKRKAILKRVGEVRPELIKR